MSFMRTIMPKQVVIWSANYWLHFMTNNSLQTPYAVPIDHLDEAAQIFSDYTEKAFEEMMSKQLDIGAAIQAIVQMSMRSYADLIGDDMVAIRQIRQFIDDWETEADALPLIFSVHN